MGTHRAAIVGTGGIAGAHALALRACPERVQIVAAMDIDPQQLEAFCQEHGVSAKYTDLDSMLTDQRPDVVHVCSSSTAHGAATVRSLQAGAWVLCEKPICGSLRELDQIEAAQGASGPYAASVLQQRFGSSSAHVKALVDQGAFGRPLVAQCVSTWYRDRPYYAVPWRGQWRTALGGATTTQGIHAIDLMLWLLGDWSELRATMDTLDRDIEVEDVSMAHVQFENGALASVLNSVLCPREETFLRFDFRDATVELRHLYAFENKHWTITAAPHVDPADLEAWRAFGPDVPTSHAAQVSAFLNSMDEGRPPLTSGPEARRAIEFITSLYKSARTGEPVVRGSIVEGDAFYDSMHGG